MSIRFTPAARARSIIAARVALVDGGDRRHARPEGHRAEREHRHLEPARPEAPSLHGGQSARSQLGAVIAVASSAPSGPGTRRNLTAVSGAMARVPSAMAVQWNGKRIPPPRLDLAAAREVVEARDPARVDGLHAGRQWTILEIGSSMMPLAPRSSSAGISVLISLLATTVSTAKPSSPNSFDTVGDFSAGQQRDHAVEVGGVDVELEQHPAPGLERAGEQRSAAAPSPCASRDRRTRSGLAISSVYETRMVSRIAQPGGAQRTTGLGDLDDRVGDVGDLGLGRAVRQLRPSASTPCCSK